MRKQSGRTRRGKRETLFTESKAGPGRLAVPAPGDNHDSDHELLADAAGSDNVVQKRTEYQDGVGGSVVQQLRQNSER